MLHALAAVGAGNAAQLHFQRHRIAEHLQLPHATMQSFMDLIARSMATPTLHRLCRLGFKLDEHLLGLQLQLDNVEPPPKTGTSLYPCA